MVWYRTCALLQALLNPPLRGLFALLQSIVLAGRTTVSSELVSRQLLVTGLAGGVNHPSCYVERANKSFSGGVDAMTAAPATATGSKERRVL